ncbi:MAG: CCA tRNA nucleotidyltransferase [Methanobacteriota archaeon]|nr:MAG: CCA tRNA nucleotidyltransferase [Euryarchaeota archaeon]
MLEDVLKRIRPTEEEKSAMAEVCARLLEKVAGRLMEVDGDLTAEVLGSVSRDTWLAREKDIDLFVKFPTTYSKRELEETVTALGKELLEKVEKRFAEHPYIRGRFEGYDVEIIPCYEVKAATERVSAVDRTPFHDRFVRENLGGRADEVRLLKQFLKGIGCYGAEARTEGFSGYLCELLIIRYGSFEETLRAASKWRPPVSIGLKGAKPCWEGQTQPAPMSFPDPTDSQRNVASALSMDRLSLFIYAAKEFLREPRQTFFFPNRRKADARRVVERLRERGTWLVALSFTAPDVIEDILYTQLRKTVRTLERLLSERDFTVIQSGFHAGERITVAFELESPALPAARLHQGPPVNSPREEDFLRKHRGSEKALGRPFIRGDRWAVFLKREQRAAEGLIRDFLSQRGLRRKGIPSYMAGEIEKGFSILTAEEAVKENPGLYAELFDPLFPWEV